MVKEIDCWYGSENVYANNIYSKIGNNFPGINSSKIVASTKNNKASENYEGQGLQASLIAIKQKNGSIEYVIAVRGSSDTKDFVTDASLNDPNAYKTNSKFSDFEDFINMCQMECHVSINKYGFGIMLKFIILI